MASNSNIEWCDATWNPVVGCSHISPGCDHCYAARMAHRLGKNPATPQYAGLTGPDGKWLGKARFVQKALDMPLTWRNPKRIFVVSMGDLFHPSVYFAWVDQVFARMILAPQHTYMLLTKRPDRMRQYLESVTPADLVAASHGAPCRPVPLPGFPLPNVILMATVENQPAADERMPHLMALAGMGWHTGVSVEPMLGEVLMRRIDKPAGGGHVSGYDYLAGVEFWPHHCDRGKPRLSWVVAGGETGPDARPAHPDWFRSLRDQCADAGTPFFFKGWGEHLPVVRISDWDWRGHKGLKHYLPPDLASLPCGRLKWEVVEEDGSVLGSFKLDDHPNAYNMFRVGKARAGRVLDGKEWNEFPEARPLTCSGLFGPSET